MIKKIPLIFCFLALTVFAQNESHPIVEVDSAAYYEEMYNYNFQKYRTDESISDALFWTSVIFTVTTPIAALTLASWSLNCDPSDGKDCKMSPLHWGLAVPLLLVLPSWITYGGFEIAKTIRKSNYYKYYRKHEDYVRRKELEENAHDEQPLSVQVIPFVDVANDRFWAALALGF